MLVLRDPQLTARITDPEMRELVERRFTQIAAGEEYDWGLQGYMIVVESGDSVAALEDELGFPVLRNLYDEARFGDPEFAPAAEVLEEHPSCYEMVFILNDDGFAILIFVPKIEGVDPRLLAMCATFATLADELKSS